MYLLLFPTSVNVIVLTLRILLCIIYFYRHGKQFASSIHAHIPSSSSSSSSPPPTVLVILVPPPSASVHHIQAFGHVGPINMNSPLTSLWRNARQQQQRIVQIGPKRRRCVGWHVHRYQQRMDGRLTPLAPPSCNPH